MLNQRTETDGRSGSGSVAATAVARGVGTAATKIHYYVHHVSNYDVPPGECPVVLEIFVFTAGAIDATREAVEAAYPARASPPDMLAGRCEKPIRRTRAKHFLSLTSTVATRILTARVPLFSVPGTRSARPGRMSRRNFAKLDHVVARGFSGVV